MRPSQKASEERKWVVDAINKYFEVIVEEEEEEEEEEEDEDEVEGLDSDGSYDDEEIESLGEIDYEDSEEENELSESDVEENRIHNAESTFRSTAKIRGLLSTAITNISSSKGDLSDTHLLSDQKQGLLNNLKQKLGSQISLKRRSQDYLNAI